MYRVPLRFPFALPVFVALVGSVLAVSNATSAPASLMALAKDAYLYFWFVALVAVLQPRGALRGVRLAWVWTAGIVALLVFVQAAQSGGFSLQEMLISNRGERARAVGSFSNPNMFADYLMFSIFVLLGLAGQLRKRFLAPALALLVMALLTTKSNGGLVSLVAGLLVWAFATAWARGITQQRLAGMAVLGLGVVIASVWLHAELGVGDALVQRVTSQSYVGRMSHSSESREQIWHRLEETYARSPLGIGPKNSSEQTLDISERERPDSFRSKEAHNDYLAFAVERGPLGLAGLLLGTGMVIAMVLGGRRKLDRRLGSALAGGALWAAFLGALAGSSVHSLVIEKLHFRHFWLFLAVVTAMCTEAAPAIEPAPRRALEPAGRADALPALRG
jgi:O-antigen ligase